MADIVNAEEVAAMDRHERLVAAFENDAGDSDAWEDDNIPAAPDRALGATITVRFDEETAKRLRDRASAKGVGYTTLLRTWVQERLDVEDQHDYLTHPVVFTHVAQAPDLERRSFSYYALHGQVSKAS